MPGEWILVLPSLFQNSTYWRKRIEKSCAKTARGLGRDNVFEPVSIVFNGSFQYTSSWYTLWLANCDSLLQHLRQSFCFARAESNKHVEQVKASYTAHFDVSTFKILTRETVFHGVIGVVGWLNGINLGFLGTDHPRTPPLTQHFTLREK